MKHSEVKNRIKYTLSNRNCKVMWVKGTKSIAVPEMHNKPVALCYWWVRENKHNSDYAGGKLVVVSMIEKSLI